MSWKDGGADYLPQIGMVESQCGIPTDLLARIAYQECSWRTEVISGQVLSPAGAKGMFQLMPQFFPGAGVSWMQDAETAGRYLAQLHRQFNDWQLAVAAYNWGPGNLSRYEQNPSVGLPQETKNYIAGVFTDVPIVGSLYGSLEA
jgi:soluble lytic murein transglycosylase-like protein